jgi:predicted RNase H-like HicB family nuclease
MWGIKEQPSLAFKIAYVVEEDEGGFHAFAPAFKGLHVDGNTRDEATRNLIKGLQVYIESLAKHGDPLPVGPGPPNSRVTIHYHPKKTYGAKLLKGLLEDIGWSEEDMERLQLIK